MGLGKATGSVGRGGREVEMTPVCELENQNSKAYRKEKNGKAEA
jgi:hypothetical protein